MTDQMHAPRYGFCAKCLEPKPLDDNYVCGECHGTSGLFHGCAVCGEVWDEEGRWWVCWADLKHINWVSPEARRKAFAAAKANP
jgi:hypothetical protein